MTPVDSRIDETALALNDWFASVLRTCDGVFQVSEDDAHRAATVQAMLTHHAKVIVDSEIDNTGELYPAVAKALAAACRRLGIEPNVRHWKAAIQNVLATNSQIDQPDETLRLAIGSPATVFKMLLDEALINAGVTDRPTILVEENRKMALGLAVNWGMRFLLAYALQLRPKTRRLQNVKDAWWIRSLIASP